MFRVVLPSIIRSAYNCIYSIKYLSHRYCYLPLSWKGCNQFECAVGGVRKYHPKHVEQFPDINKLCNVASCWIYTGIVLGAHPILHISRIRVKHKSELRATCFYRPEFKHGINTRVYSSVHIIVNSPCRFIQSGASLIQET
jgi:hypothetical protein